MFYPSRDEDYVEQNKQMVEGLDQWPFAPIVIILAITLVPCLTGAIIFNKVKRWFDNHEWQDK